MYACYAKLAKDVIITLTNCCAERRERERELHLSQVSSEDDEEEEDEDEIAIGWEKLACRMPPPPQHACSSLASSGAKLVATHN